MAELKLRGDTMEEAFENECRYLRMENEALTRQCNHLRNVCMSLKEEVNKLNDQICDAVNRAEV